MKTWIVVDIATAPIADAATFIEGGVRPPANYKDPDKIADYIREKEAERLQMAATDVDLARITGIGFLTPALDGRVCTMLAKDEQGERIALSEIAHELTGARILTYGGFRFDLPVLMRRARYLGIAFPSLNLDRFRSDHEDLCERLSDRDTSRRRSLQFYAKRLGWTDLAKTLQGADEARVHETGRWDDLRASIEHDVTATYRLAQWLGLIQPQPEMSAAQMATGF